MNFTSLTKLAVGVLFLAYASLSVASQGWVVVASDKNNNPIQMVNESEQGNQLILTCDTKTKKLDLSYNSGATEYDFFIFRNFGEIDMSTPKGKMIIGSGSVTQANLYKNLMDANKAFVVTYYPVGTKYAWDEAIKLQLDTVADIHQEGESFFLSGDVKSLLEGMSKNCPVNTPNKPIL